MKKITIYLSSTYDDLKEHRRAVFDALRKSGYEVIAMEDYVASDDRVVEACLKDIDEHADIYVGIFAFRTVTFLPGSTFAHANTPPSTTIGKSCPFLSWSFAMPLRWSAFLA